MAKYEIEMARYRARAAKPRRAKKGGSRAADVREPFWAIGWVLEGILLLVAGAWFLSACARYYL